jgi:genome maintenance exonuclease 1
MFQHELIELPTLIRHDGESRYYETPDGKKYPSVTTVLGAMKDKSGLIAWRARVGEEEANRISVRATTRGTAVHSLCESYVLNMEKHDNEVTVAMPINRAMFRQIQKVLDANVSNIRISEGSLYSHNLKIAGSVDLVALWNGRLAIIDFKTSGSAKDERWIEDYFLQCSLYCYMLWERTGLVAQDLVVIIALEDGNEAQVFKRRIADYMPKAKKICEAYHEKFGAVL